LRKKTIDGGEVLIGEVKRWLDRRGYGFIDVEEQEEDVFVHYSELRGTYSLIRGQTVEFELESSFKGPRAVNVKVIN
jgi:CspA family cold shock protein